MSENFNKKFRTALFKIGQIIPESTEEIEEFEKIINEKDLPDLPDIFGTPSKIVQQGKFSPTYRDSSVNDDQLDANHQMARAAREGSKSAFPKEISDKMKKDRLDAEDKT